jgi:hypothetical protein
MVVSVKAETISVRADGTGDCSSIQAAINAANNGDEVVLEAGTYNGEGNYNLNFKGKAITVRSLYPENNMCMRETIIDANGQGVIVRFLTDEGPESVLLGFSLVGGDMSLSGRGTPGFFEFSNNARPTIKRVRIKGDKTSSPLLARTHISRIGLLQAGPPYGGRLWDGNNPFHQPAATTDYYGSGDVDNDGNLTATDVSLAQEMANALIPPCIMADVDGDGDVDNNDVSLINNALGGGTLGGWWNSLPGRTERDAWVNKFLAVEKTDQHPHRYWFQCGHFSEQLYIHGACYRGDLYQTLYDGGQAWFNIPLYTVTVMGPAFGHAINAILAGDDPLNFNDWRFIEPQSDDDVNPGMWDMPYNSDVTIYLPSEISINGGTMDIKVDFYVDESGWTLENYCDDLLLTRPEPSVVQPDNHADLWNPRIVPIEEGKILFEQAREDMTHMTDIHQADLPFVDPPESSPLTLSSQYSRLLDVSVGDDGAIHLLWKEKPDYIPGLFHGTIDPVTTQLGNISRVSTGTRTVGMGRLVTTREGETHVFWLEHKFSTIHPYDTGIYWTQWTGSAWRAEENIAPYPDFLLDYSDWEKRDCLRYYFDVDVAENGDIIVVWAEPVGYTEQAVIRQVRYDGTWGSITDIETTNVRGIELLTDSLGTLHMVYWLGGRFVAGRGHLLHRTSNDNGSSWSAAETIYGDGNAGYPRMTAGAGGVVYLVWEREIDGQVVPALAKYGDGVWDTAEELNVRPGADAWYPTADLVSGSLVVMWSSRSTDRVAIEMKAIELIVGDLDHDGDVDFNDFAILADQWQLEQLSWDIAPNGGDGIVDFLDWTVFADGWQDTTDIEDMAVFVDQWLKSSAYSADIAPDGGDGIVDWFDLGAIANDWLAGTQ